VFCTFSLKHPYTPKNIKYISYKFSLKKTVIIPLTTKVLANIAGAFSTVSLPLLNCFQVHISSNSHRKSLAIGLDENDRLNHKI
jgi:hypothetical protein